MIDGDGGRYEMTQLYEVEVYVHAQVQLLDWRRLPAKVTAFRDLNKEYVVLELATVPRCQNGLHPIRVRL